MKNEQYQNNADKRINTNPYDTLTEDITCGIGYFHPKWLQVLASKKVLVIVYALIGMQSYVISAYHVGTLSTIEKNFNMSSRMSGIITGACDIGTLMTNLLVTYVAAKGHRTRWVATGTLVMALSCFMRIMPYLIFGAGENIQLYTKEYENLKNTTDFSFVVTGGNSSEIKKLNTNVNCQKNDTNSTDMTTFYLFFLAQMLVGIGTTVYWTCGATYVDDNVRKNIVPILFAFVQAIRLFGPTVGFMISSFSLRIYVEPSLTPTITNEDPRWIGAWWLGWYPIGIVTLICAIAMALFPKTLPRAAIRKKDNPILPSDPLSLADFKQSMSRILKNKILVYNTLSGVTYIIGLMSFWTFMPKYLESQFRLSTTNSSLLSGTIGTLSNAVGIMISGLIISKLKPSPRYLAGWNVIVEALDVVGRIIYSLISCPEPVHHGHWNTDQSWNLTENCNVKHNCSTDIQYAPVCDKSRDLVFYSSCHAGCISSSMINNTLVYSDCSCVPNSGTVVDGLCSVDCSSNILLFMIILTVLGFTSASGRAGNTLLQFRCVEERDKSLSIGVTELILALLAFLPGPILYGIVIDWTCIVWGDNCGSKGNCWIYNNNKLRLSFNFISAGFLFMGTIFDCFVWYYAKGLKIYDEDFLDEKPKKTADEALSEKLATNDQPDGVDLSLISTQKIANNTHL